MKIAKELFQLWLKWFFHVLRSLIIIHHGPPYFVFCFNCNFWLLLAWYGFLIFWSAYTDWVILREPQSVIWFKVLTLLVVLVFTIPQRSLDYTPFILLCHTSWAWRLLGISLWKRRVPQELIFVEILIEDFQPILKFTLISSMLFCRLSWVMMVNAIKLFGLGLVSIWAIWDFSNNQCIFHHLLGSLGEFFLLLKLLF